MKMKILAAFATWGLALSATGPPKALPEGPIIAAWQNWGACNETTTLRQVQEGVNVIFWFAITRMIEDPETRKPKIMGGPNPDCVAEVRAAIQQLELPTSHLISIGGWNSPHPNTSFTGKQWFEAWEEWNNKLPAPFDGFDWDLEGNDWLPSQWNKFSPDCLQLVIDMSTAAKDAGLLVTMAPPQTYFDVTRREFNRYLNNSDPSYHPEFHYQGRNAYAYVWAAAPPGTFDLVEFQLYETFAPALQSLQQGVSGEDYLRDWAADVLSGWEINVTDPLLPTQGLLPIHVQQSQFLVGLSFGSAGRSVYFTPEAVQSAYEAAEPSRRPRGYAFWNLEMDGRTGVNGTSQTVDLAKSLNAFLHVRQSSSSFGPLLI